MEQLSVLDTCIRLKGEECRAIAVNENSGDRSTQESGETASDSFHSVTTSRTGITYEPLPCSQTQNVSSPVDPGGDPSVVVSRRSSGHRRKESLVVEDADDDDIIYPIDEDICSLATNDSDSNMGASDDPNWFYAIDTTEMQNILSSTSTNSKSLLGKRPYCDTNMMVSDCRGKQTVPSSVRQCSNQVPWSKPPYSYSCLVSLALRNSKSGFLAVGDIYKFIRTNFPFYETAAEGWKNCVRHNLSSNPNFVKTEMSQPDSHGRKSYLWSVNPAKKHKIDLEVKKIRARDYETILHSLRNPGDLEAIENGQKGIPVDVPEYRFCSEDEWHDFSLVPAVSKSVQKLAPNDRSNITTLNDTRCSRWPVNPVCTSLVDGFPTKERNRALASDSKSAKFFDEQKWDSRLRSSEIVDDSVVPSTSTVSCIQYIEIEDNEAVKFEESSIGLMQPESSASIESEMPLLASAFNMSSSNELTTMFPSINQRCFSPIRSSSTRFLDENDENIPLYFSSPVSRTPSKFAVHAETTIQSMLNNNSLMEAIGPSRLFQSPVRTSKE